MDSVVLELLKEGKISINDVKKAYKKITNKELLDKRTQVLDEINKITIRWDVPIKHSRQLNMSYDGITIPLSSSIKELIVEELKKEIA